MVGRAFLRPQYLDLLLDRIDWVILNLNLHRYHCNHKVGNPEEEKMRYNDLSVIDQQFGHKDIPPAQPTYRWTRGVKDICGSSSWHMSTSFPRERRVTPTVLSNCTNLDTLGIKELVINVCSRSL